MRELRRGISGLGDAVAHIMTINEDPERHVLRVEHEDQPATWSAVIESPSWIANLAVDPADIETFTPVLVIFLVELVDQLRREHPEVVRDHDLGALLVAVLDRAREWPS